MFDSKPTTGYRFPKIHDLFLAFVPLKTQVPDLIEYIESCVKQSQDELLNSEDFVYKAPGEGRVSPGLAVKEGRAFLRSWVAPVRETSIRDRPFTEGRVESLSTALDYFHQTNREWRRQIKIVRTAIDEAAVELDQGTNDLLRLPSVEIRLAVDELSRAVPYDGEGIFDSPDWPLFDAAWIKNIKDLWPPVGKWMQRTRSIGHMSKPTNLATFNAAESETDPLNNRDASAEPNRESKPLSGSSAVQHLDPVEPDPKFNSPEAHSAPTGDEVKAPNPLLRSLSHSGQFWTVQFDGRMIHMKDSLGMRLLSVLLLSPNKPFSSELLYRQATNSGPDSKVSDAAISAEGYVTGDGPHIGGNDDRLDERSIRELTAERDQLLMEAGRSGTPPDKATEFRERADAIEQQLKADLNPSGKPRKLGSDAQKTRTNSIQQALKTLRTQLREHHQEDLANYLKDRVSTGKVVSFRPRAGEQDWATV